MNARTSLRFLGSLALALCVVLAMLWFALELTGFTDRAQRRPLEAHEVGLLSDVQRERLGSLLGEGRVAPGPVPRAEGGIAPIDPAREQRGVVRLDVAVDSSGRVADVRVIDAEPAGIYESQAIAEIRARRYEPEVIDGRAVPSRHLEIIDFTIRAAAE